ncbi:hypothetical protein [Terribacillus saccharophilus]|uniref:hypothetical protein n=1 Tax=Terribacillus saccharophilus TaxID=361277 RepID=UPI002989C0C0|nr:hypothetical protein [Terribacillus saccharophilus]MCM3227506.1 hypothetical protein [Terribacillus saccharophilus]
MNLQVVIILVITAIATIILAIGKFKLQNLPSGRTEINHTNHVSIEQHYKATALYNKYEVKLNLSHSYIRAITSSIFSYFFYDKKSNSIRLTSNLLMVDPYNCVTRSKFVLLSQVGISITFKFNTMEKALRCCDACKQFIDDYTSSSITEAKKVESEMEKAKLNGFVVTHKDTKRG